MKGGGDCVGDCPRCLGRVNLFFPHDAPERCYGYFSPGEVGAQSSSATCPRSCYGGGRENLALVTVSAVWALVPFLLSTAQCTSLKGALRVLKFSPIWGQGTKRPRELR